MADGRTIRILSIEGSGMRAILPAVLLAAMEKQSGKPLCKQFDMITGVSAGGLLAAGLVTPRQGKKKPLSAGSLVDFLMENGCRIFDTGFLRKIAAFGKASDASFTSEGLVSCLEQLFGDRRLSDCYKNVELMIPACDIERGRALFFKSWEARGRLLRQGESVGSHDYQVRDMVLASFTTPSLFPPAVIEPVSDPGGRVRTLVDGSVIAPSPALCAWTEVRKLFPDAAAVDILSLGSGVLPDRAPSRDRKAGAGTAALSLTSGGAEVVHRQLSEIYNVLGAGRYTRLDISLDSKLTGIPDVYPDPDNCQDKNRLGLKALGEKLVEESADILASWCPEIV